MSDVQSFSPCDVAVVLRVADYSPHTLLGGRSLRHLTIRCKRMRLHRIPSLMPLPFAECELPWPISGLV
jgi:hypothetical protein